MGLLSLPAGLSLPARRNRTRFTSGGICRLRNLRSGANAERAERIAAWRRAGRRPGYRVQPCVRPRRLIRLRPFTWTSTIDEIFAKVCLTQINIKKLVANNAK